MAKTVNDVLSGLHERAKVSIPTQRLIDIINNEFRDDVRNDFYSRYKDYFDELFVFRMFKIGQSTAALAGSGSGNVDNGEYRYKITFTTPERETFGGVESDAIQVIDNTANGQVSITAIPVGDSTVTERKVYRQQNGFGPYYLIGTISDNTTTTFTDNVAQATAAAAAEMPIGITMPSNWSTIDYRLVDDNGYEIKYYKPVEGLSTQTISPWGKRFHWLADGQIAFDPDHPFNGKTLRLSYLSEIGEVSSTSDNLTYPTVLHENMLNMIRKGVSYYYLREKDSARDVQYLEGEYNAARIQFFDNGPSGIQRR